MLSVANIDVPSVSDLEALSRMDSPAPNPFSIKLSKNKVSNKRYIYGVSSDTELDRNIIKEIGLSNDFQRITNKFLDSK